MNEQRATSNEQLHGVFIDVRVDDAIASDAELARKLSEVCPVDIFSVAAGRVRIVPENLDECILCEICVETAPPAAVRVVKLYDGTALKR